jgi:hypothetical protein
MDPSLESSFEMTLTTTSSKNLSLDDHFLSTKGLGSLEGFVCRVSCDELGNGNVVLLELSKIQDEIEHNFSKQISPSSQRRAAGPYSPIPWRDARGY